MAGQGQDQGKSDLSRLRIAKKAYVFDVRRKYALNRQFAVKKKAETPAEDIKDQLLELLRKKPPTEKEERDTASAKAQSAAPQARGPSAKTSIALFGVLVVLFFLIASAVYVMIKIGSYGPEAAPAQKPNVFSGDYGFSAKQSDLLSAPFGDGVGRAAYLRIEYSSKNVSQLAFAVKLLGARPATQAFLLDYAREGADSYPVFRRYLLDSLRQRGLPASEIGIEELGSLPGGAIVVVPTGYFPKELASEGPSDYKALLSRGSSIVYIGFAIDRTLDRKGSVSAVSLPDLAFGKAKPASSEGFKLFDAQYVASAAGGGFSGGGTLYGTVSYVKYGQGTLIFLPQSLDGGWRGTEKVSPGEAAARDVVKLIEEERWLSPLAYAKQNATAGADKKNTLSLFTPAFSADSAYAEIAADAVDLQGVRSRTLDVFEVKKRQRGEMSPREPNAVPYYLSGQMTRFNIQLREGSPQPVKLYVRIYDAGTLVQEDELELGLTNPTVEKPKDVPINIRPGTYVARVEDAEGKVYAACRLDVIGVDIAVDRANWASKQFSFLLSSAGEPVSPRSLAISMDSRYERRFTPSSYYSSGKSTGVMYEYPGEIKPGNHTFYFSVGNFTTSVLQDYKPQKYPWDNPLVIVLALLSVLVFGVGMVLRRPEVLRYGLDIPDFPPMSSTKIPVKRETVLQLFDDANASYSWQWMPLRPEEVKGGFRRLTYNGKPILIGDFNLERILARLKEEGLVKEELGYWGLARWESDSKHSMIYLAMYRIMRNVFVNNAVRFSKMDAMPDCDVKAVVGKEEVYMHIMDGALERVAHRALATAKRGTSIMVFKNEEERDRFKGSLTSTSKLAVALKMEVNAGNILLLPVKNAISSFLKGVVK